MKPKPVNDEPEQYDVTTCYGGDLVIVTAIASGKNLDKWHFKPRREGQLVLVKHIGGEKYEAKHTVPEAIPLVIRQALWGRDYRVISPDETYTVAEKPDGTRTARLPVSDDGDVVWDEVRDATEEWAKPVVEG